MTTNRKPALPNLSALIRGMEGDGANVDATDAELRAVEAVIRALDAVTLMPGKAADRLIAAVARLDRLTQRTP